MVSRFSRPFSARRAALLGAVLLAGTAWPALAADTVSADTPAETAPLAQDEAASDEEILVTGYRASLESSTQAKKAAVGFTDEIFAEAEDRFFYKVVDAQLTFFFSDDGKATNVVLHQGGRTMPGKKIE